MRYIKITFPAAPQAGNDVLIAMLAGVGYEGFEETPEGVLAYISEEAFAAEDLEEIAATLDAAWEKEIVEQQNWNALWESNFQPVIIDGYCTIRAHFHDMKVDTPYEIIITPKMSFGTGHHATTQLMITLMKDVPFTGKKVLDFGSGTGVLAIMAELLGAAEGLALDNDQWCVENAAENVERNNCTHISTELASSLEDVRTNRYEVVLANINRHILLDNMADMYSVLKKEGSLLMSGLLVEDETIVTEAASAAGFSYIKTLEKDGWIALLFRK